MPTPEVNTVAVVDIFGLLEELEKFGVELLRAAGAVEGFVKLSLQQHVVGAGLAGNAALKGLAGQGALALKFGSGPRAAGIAPQRFVLKAFGGLFQQVRRQNPLFVAAVRLGAQDEDFGGVGVGDSGAFEFVQGRQGGGAIALTGEDEDLRESSAS